MPRRDEPHSPAPDVTSQNARDLLQRAQAGDSDALNALIACYLPRMRRWAAGRLPDSTRGITDTHDLVQDCLFQASRKIDRFEIRGEGAFQAYLRQTLMNQIRQEVRRATRRPRCDDRDIHEIAAHIADPAPSPVEQAIGRQALERYEQALARLRPSDRQAIVARIELGCSFQEVAEGLGKPTANAARMAVERALTRLVQCMNEGSGR